MMDPTWLGGHGLCDPGMRLLRWASRTWTLVAAACLSSQSSVHNGPHVWLVPLQRQP